MSGNTNHPREDKGSGSGAAGSGSGSSSNNRNWTNEALHFSKGSVRLHEFRNAWERTIQDAKAKLIVVGNESNNTNATKSSSSSNYERNQHTSPVWGGLQTAFSSSFENAALERKELAVVVVARFKRDHREERHAESEGHHGEHHEEFAKAARRMGRV